MEKEKQLTVRDRFLKNIQESQNPVNIFLANGVKLEGKVTNFDGFSLLLTRGRNSQLVNHFSIASINEIPRRYKGQVTQAGYPDDPDDPDELGY